MFPVLLDRYAASSRSLGAYGTRSQSFRSSWPEWLAPGPRNGTRLPSLMAEAMSSQCIWIGGHGPGGGGEIGQLPGGASNMQPSGGRIYKAGVPHPASFILLRASTR